jgi:uncharacterized protein YfaP (DUF2135 family)
LANLADFSTASSTTTFSGRDVPLGTYHVRVRARNGFGTSGPSNEAILVVGAAECSGALTARLTWNTGSQTGTPTQVDMDLHVTEPGGEDVWGGNLSGATVHVVTDNTTGFGPETICASGAAASGVYHIDMAAYEGNEWPTTATVSVTTSVGTLSFIRVFTGPDFTTAQRVATVTFPGGIVTEATGTQAIDVRAAADVRPKR